tara:strand:- start:772 stop:2922 length:2151 start_codon:yes stop_codon:yes gene_type:complete
MSVQEVEVSKRGSGSGFKREINEGAMGLVLDTIQITQYVKPEESTVRELTANAVDSQREKEIAINILSGEAQAKDYFLERDGAKYKDSNWDAEYYDLKHLNRDKNEVELEYIEGEGTGYCDQFIIRDHGIGIGASRLEGYFQIGYSTKRNSKASLGAFGFGNKVALSTRCDFYTVETVHNGKRFKFNCYSYKIDSLVPRFNLEKEKENDYTTFSDGSKVYFEETEDKNYTEINVPTKRFHRSKYRQAVKSQLLYFPNVKYTTVSEAGYRHDEDFKAEVLYNSDRLIVSNNSQFSKPHIVIVKGEQEDKATGVCYGFVDFQEMEMQQLYGNVGIKCPIRSVIRDDETGIEEVLQEGVEVTPSRESVVWSEHTRNFLVNRFKEAVVEATDMIKDEIDVDDFLEWIGKCSGVKAGLSNTSNRALYQLSKVINVDDISPSYKSTSIQLQHPETFFRGLRVRYCYSSYDHGKKRSVVKRDELKRWGDFTAEKVYMKTMPTSSKVDHFLHEIDGSFVTIEIMDDDQLTKEYLTNPVLSKRVEPKYLAQCIEKRDEIVKLIKASTKVKNYDNTNVPSSFGKKYEEAEVKDKEIAMSAKEKRKTLGKIAVHQMVPNSAYWSGCTDKKPFTFTQKDEAIVDIQDYAGELIYGFNDDAPHLMLLGQVLDAQAGNGIHKGMDYSNMKFHSPELRIVKISKQSEKHFKNNERFKHVSDFFQKAEDING